MDPSSSSEPSRSGNRKRNLSQVAPHDVVEINEDDIQNGVMIISENISCYKKKQPLGYANGLRKNSLSSQDTSSNNLVGSNTNYGSRNDDPLETLKSSEPEPKRQSTNDKKKIEDEIDIKYKTFEQFDTVQDHSDHHFSRHMIVNNGPTVAMDWLKRIQYEWKILKKDLPETIYVRAYEGRTELLRAVIIGAAGTPYHDGLFFFDILFPPNYPHVPPLVHYHSGGLNINPNLYACGKVCLSLLNTWSGVGCEMWIPSVSTMLQVLVSIQGLILNAKPYFNEPGVEDLVNLFPMERQSVAYNEGIFLSSCRTMLYSLRRPPKHFEDFVAGHYRERGPAILTSIVAYMNGARVGDDVRGAGLSDTRCKPGFESSLSKLFEDLLSEFTIKGADCDEMVAERAKHGAVGPAGGDGILARGAGDAESSSDALPLDTLLEMAYDTMSIIELPSYLTSFQPAFAAHRPPPPPISHGFAHLIRHPCPFSASSPQSSSCTPRLFSAPQARQPQSGPTPLQWRTHFALPLPGLTSGDFQQWIPPPPLPLPLPPSLVALPPLPPFPTTNWQWPPTQPHGEPSPRVSSSPELGVPWHHSRPMAGNPTGGSHSTPWDVVGPTTPRT